MEIEQEEAERSKRKRGFDKISKEGAEKSDMIPVDVEIKYHQNKSLLEKTVPILIEHLNKFGACVIDDFLGEETCEDIMTEVVGLQQQQLLCSGRTKQEGSNQYRSDRIVWTDGIQPYSPHLQSLIRSAHISPPQSVI